MVIVIIGWIFFASPDLGWAVDYIKILFGAGKNAFIDSNFIYYIKNYLILLIILIIASRPFVYNIFSKLKKQDNSWAIIAAIIEFAMFVIVIAYLLNASYNPFLYFRF